MGNVVDRCNLTATDSLSVNLLALIPGAIEKLFVLVKSDRWPPTCSAAGPCVLIRIG